VGRVEGGVNKSVRFTATAESMLLSLLAGKGGNEGDWLALAIEKGLASLGASAPAVTVVDFTIRPSGVRRELWRALSKNRKQKLVQAINLRARCERVISEVSERRDAVAGKPQAEVWPVEYTMHLNALRDDAALCRRAAVREIAKILRHARRKVVRLAEKL
jgi:hypothetical protein